MTIDSGVYYCCYCYQPAIMLSEEVWFCNKCQIGHSINEFDLSIYDDKYYRKYSDKAETDISKRIALSRVGLVSTFVPVGNKVLDFGSGMGFFLRGIIKAGYKGVGLEITNGLSSDIPIETSLKACGQVDAITFFDTLEHVPNIKSTFKSILADNLVDGGIVVITMPELQYFFGATSDSSYLQREFKEWRHNKPKEHLTYFTRQGLKMFMESFNLEVVYETNSESFLRVDKQNFRTNIMTVVGRKPIPVKCKPTPITFSGCEVNK